MNGVVNRIREFAVSCGVSSEYEDGDVSKWQSGESALSRSDLLGA